MIFSPEQLQTIITQQLPTDAKPGEKVVIGTVDQYGAQVVASFKLKSVWEIQAAVKHDWTGANSAGAKILLRW